MDEEEGKLSAEDEAKLEALREAARVGMASGFRAFHSREELRAHLRSIARDAIEQAKRKD